MAYLSVTAFDLNSATKALTGDETKIIKYHSDVRATMELKNGVMNLDACVITNGSKRVYDKSGTFNDVESNEFRFSCQDADGISHNETVTMPMVNYIPLTCYIAKTAIDGNGTATVECKGSYFNGSFGKVSNTISAVCRCIDSAGEYIGEEEMFITEQSQTYYASAEISGLEYDKRYTFEIEVTDKLETANTSKRTSSKPGFHWGKDDFVFEIPVEAHKGLRIGENSSSVNEGNYLLFGDSSITDNYCYIAEVADDVMTIYSRCGINLKTADGFPVNVNGKPLTPSAEVEYGEWTPSFTNYSAITDETYREGWYMKVGKVVTIGFYIKVDCDTYSSSTHGNIRIEGLPYTPLIPAAGGGMCSGAYVSGGYDFQCYVAGIDGTITTRVQRCNNTSDTNLSTSSSGCKFGDNSEMTLSGTITYLTD